MKAENFAKLILQNCITKKGELRNDDYEMLYHILFKTKDKKRTFHWSNRGRSARDSHYRDINTLTKLGIDYGYFNDAPRGGQEGNYIIITTKGLRRIQPFVKKFISYVGTKEKDEKTIINLCKLIAIGV